MRGRQSLIEYGSRVIGGLRAEYVCPAAIQDMNVGALEANDEVKSRLTSGDCDRMPGPKAKSLPVSYFTDALVERFNERLTLLGIRDLGLAKDIEAMKVMLSDKGQKLDVTFIVVAFNGEQRKAVWLI